MESQNVAGAPHQGPASGPWSSLLHDLQRGWRHRQQGPLMGSVSAEQRGTALKVTACPPPLTPILEPASSAML